MKMYLLFHVSKKQTERLRKKLRFVSFGTGMWKQSNIIKFEKGGQ